MPPNEPQVAQLDMSAVVSILQVFVENQQLRRYAAQLEGQLAQLTNMMDEAFADSDTTEEEPTDG